MFGHGALRLYLLHLLEEGPRHGYELIRMLEDRFMGFYTPSAGTIYPRLSALEEDGFVEHEVVDGRKVYRLTESGRAELSRRREEIDDIASEAVRSARELAREIRDEVRSSVRDLRREIRDAVRDVRREERRIVREARDSAYEAARTAEMLASARRVHHRRGSGTSERVSDDGGRELRAAVRALRQDLEAFVADVLSAARRHRLDASRVDELRSVLDEARAAVASVLRDGARKGDGGHG